MLHAHDLDILTLTETWLSDSVPDICITVPGYTMHRLDPNSKRGGGVSIYVRECFGNRALHHSSPIEALAVHVNIHPQPLTILCAYRAPTVPVAFWQTLSSLTDDILDCTPASSACIILGDFNVNVQDPSHAHYPHLRTFCHDFDLRNVVTSPTRFPSATTIDLALISSSSSTTSTSRPGRDELIYKDCNVIPCDISDHQLVCVNYNIHATTSTLKTNRQVQVRKPPLRTLKIKQFQETAAKHMSTLHQQITCSSSQMSLDSYTEHWQDAVSDALNEYCPLKTVNAKKSYTPSPWVDDELRQTLFKRKRAHRAMIKRPDRSDLLQQFRTLRRQCKLLTRKKRSTYFQQQLINHRNHPREQWSVMNNLLGRIKINQEPAAEVADITKTFTDVVNDTSLSGSTLRTPNGPGFIGILTDTVHTSHCSTSPTPYPENEQS
eukprot:scpid41513/ scgid1298/ 